MKKNAKLIILLYSMLFAAVSCIMLILNTTADKFGINSLRNFDYGWEMHIDKDNMTLDYNRVIDESMLGKTVMFYSYDSFIDVTVDGETIYKYGHSSMICKSPSSVYHLVTIPVDGLGKQMNINIRTVYDSKYKIDYHFEIGDSGSIVILMLYREGFDILINFVISIFGIILFILAVCQYKYIKKSTSSLYLGLLAIFFVIWTNCSLFLDQILIPFGVVQYFTYYISLMFMELTLICYIESLCDENFNDMVLLDCVMSVTLLVLQITGVYDFTESFWIFCIISSFIMVGTLIKFIRSKHKYVNKVSLISFMIFVATIIITAIWYLFNQVNGVPTTLIKFGFLIYLTVSFCIALKEVIQNLAEVKNSNELEKMAYTDALTGLPNRRKFIHDVMKHDLSDITLVSLDLNNLKYYNDTYGHDKGDELLVKAAHILKDVFDNVYRIGGDEFVALIVSATDGMMFAKQGELHTKCLAVNDFVLEIAVGYSTYKPNDEDYEDIMVRADRMMYRNKMTLKKMSKIKSVR